MTEDLFEFGAAVRSTAWTLCAAASVFLLAACGPADTPEPEASEPAPEPHVAEIRVLSTGDAASELAAAEGSVAVVNFWATWCGPCEAEMPELTEFYDEFSPRGVEFFSLSVDHPDTVEDRVRPFAEERRLPFPIVVLDAPWTRPSTWKSAARCRPPPYTAWTARWQRSGTSRFPTTRSPRPFRASSLPNPTNST